MTDFTMEKGADGVAVITWDTEGKSMNVMTMEAWPVLDGLIDDALADDAVKGIVITSGKDGTFAGGMDLNVPSSTIVFQPDGNYEDNAACDWRIACPNGKATLDFTEFATESDYDFVTVYDGADASAPKLGELSGALVDILDTHFDAGSDVMLVEFTSDESITDGGFQARYTCG